jgi:hypothetical protein
MVHFFAIVSTGDKEDLFSWHSHGADGGIIFLACIALFLLYRTF